MKPDVAAPGRWLLLVHQLPAKPAYLRVKVWRSLGTAGAVALKNSIYVLPNTEGQREAFGRILSDIGKGGGEGLLCTATMLDGMDDDQVIAAFNSARDKDYAELAKQIRELIAANRKKRPREPDLTLKLTKLRQRAAEISNIDYFRAGGKASVYSLFAQLEHSPIARTDVDGIGADVVVPSGTGRVWVTRKDVHIDRIACAWLILRFIDPKARFKFVIIKHYRHARGEFCFDMTDAEFTHEGDKCSFEVLLERAGIADKALQAIAEIIHDLDLADNKFGRPEASGIGHIIDGICLTQHDDMARVARGGALLDDVYERFRSQ